MMRLSCLISLILLKSRFQFSLSLLVKSAEVYCRNPAPSLESIVKKELERFINQAKHRVEAVEPPETVWSGDGLTIPQGQICKHHRRYE